MNKNSTVRHSASWRDRKSNFNYESKGKHRALSISSHPNQRDTTESTWENRRFNNYSSISIREYSLGGIGAGGYDCEILPNQFNIPAQHFRQIKSERELQFFADAWGFFFSDLLIAWEKRGGIQ